MFTKRIYLYFLLFYIGTTNPARNNDILIATGLKDISPNSVGLQFYSILNNTSNEDYFVELSTDQCCIDNGDDLDCDSVEIIGECSQVVEKGKVKAFTMVAPVLDPYQRKGYCVIHIDSRPLDKRNKIIRDVVKIDFNTGVAVQNNNLNLQKLVKLCEERDLDPLNDCKPVNCDTYYNGKKPIFDKHKKKCTEPPKCHKESEIFDPESNQCIDEDSIDKDDIDFIKTKIEIEHRKPKNAILDETNNSYDVTEKLIRTPIVNTEIKKKCYTNMLSNILKYLIVNRYTLFTMILVILVQCLFICTMMYCLTKRTYFNDEKTVERKFFNYRQDVSVTTPLIGTSNIDTDTIDFDYVSESNIDKKIKCYKACQKKNDNKGMSDDILSKCLTRRDWNVKPKSDTNQPNDTSTVPVHSEWNKKVKDYVKDIEKVDKDTETDIIDQKEESMATFKEFNSEKLIECHDYNMKTDRNFLERKTSSTDKGAQANFSNDTVDDFLSERGLIFLAGDGLSKNSFASNSTTYSDLDRSSKTSKNNIIKNTMSYLFRKSKIFTSSEPAVKSSEKSLELIHMSKASNFSSSGSVYKHMKTAKYPKESRSSIF